AAGEAHDVEPADLAEDEAHLVGRQFVAGLHAPGVAHLAAGVAAIADEVGTPARPRYEAELVAHDRQRKAKRPHGDSRWSCSLPPCGGGLGWGVKEWSRWHNRFLPPTPALPPKGGGRNKCFSPGQRP